MGLNPNTKLEALSDATLPRLRSLLESEHGNRRVMNTLIGATILRKINIGCEAGLRHQMCLPVRGQRTHTNAKTQRKLGLERARIYGYQVLKRKTKKD